MKTKRLKILAGMDSADLIDRIFLLEEILRAVDAALENEFGGFYLSAPPDSQLYAIREMLMGER